MEQSKQDLENIKTKLLEHIKKTYDEPEATKFVETINSMDDNQFIDFLKKQGLIKKDGEENQQCIFCQMIFGNIPTVKIAENKKAICILDINPISKGHAMVIPKNHIESEEALPEEVKDLANKVSKELTSAFKPQRVDEIQGNITGHQIINLLPIYSFENMNSERIKKTLEELNNLKKEFDDSKLKTIEIPKTTKIIGENPKEKEENENIITEKNTWIPKRFP